MKNLGYFIVALTLVGSLSAFDLCSFCVLKQYQAGPKYTVCAANGKTYKNGCFAWCNKSRVVHPGACNVNHNPCNCPTGRDNYKPVCSFDGETYDNSCIAKCLGKDTASSDFCLISEVKENNTNNHFPEREGGPLKIREEQKLGGEYTGMNQYPRGFPALWPQGWQGIDRVDKYNDRHSNNYQGLLYVPKIQPGAASA